MTGLISSSRPRKPDAGSFFLSVVGHVLLLAVLLLLTAYLQPAPLQLGGAGGGPGETIRVGLTGDLGGGAGTYKPALVPRPEAAPPAEKPKSEPAPQDEPPDQPVFEEAQSPKKPQDPSEARDRRPADPGTRRQPSTSKDRPAGPGVIPRQPDPGAGGRPGVVGGGGGGEGPVRLGSGIGPGIDSWYLRQVERRLAENWLQTSLGDIQQRVRTVVSFEILPDGRIENIRIEESSRIQSVDLSAQRAVRASSPLPPLPLEFRRRRVRLVAQFEYPPR